MERGIAKIHKNVEIRKIMFMKNDKISKIKIRNLFKLKKKKNTYCGFRGITLTMNNEEIRCQIQKIQEN